MRARAGERVRVHACVCVSVCACACACARAHKPTDDDWSLLEDMAGGSCFGKERKYMGFLCFEQSAQPGGRVRKRHMSITCEHPSGN